MATHNPLCYYVMHDGSFNNDKFIFKMPNMLIQQHLKPLYIKSKVEGVRVNKSFIDSGACFNVMPNSLLKRIGKYDTNLNIWSYPTMNERASGPWM